MISLFFRNLLFTVLQPGIVAGLMPFLILGEKMNDISIQPMRLYHYLGTIIFLIGLVVMLTCIIKFAVNGRGTLSPADPTKKLVISGLYRFTRNPMYLGVTMILIGEAIFFQSILLWIYCFSIFVLFNVFILFFEEPRLRKDFAKEYDIYSKKVRRWV